MPEVITYTIDMLTQRNTEVMPKEVSALNTYWLIHYLQENHPDLDLDNAIEQISQMFPCYVENLKSGQIEQVRLEHLQTPRYWFSHRFVKAFFDAIQEHIPDPRLGYKVGSTIYKTQPMLKTALGIPLLGTHGVASKVSKEAAKYNRTKQYTVKQLAKGVVDIRITHNPGIVVGEFTMQWNAGCFASYARLAGATDISVTLHCIDAGPDNPDDDRCAIWDFELRFQEPGPLVRITKAILSNVPWIKKLIERADAVENDHQEQILDRDNIINKRTSDLATANEAMSREIAERKLAEEALLQSQLQLQRYIAAIDDIGIGLWLVDADYKISLMNQTLINWFGNHCGNSCHLVLMGRNTPCPYCLLQDVINKGENARYCPAIEDGRIFEIVATPVTNNDGTVSSMEIIRDITEQKTQEDERLQTSKQKEQLIKLTSLKTMAGAVAHRFNNAMMGVQGNLEIMKSRFSVDSKEYQMAFDAFQAAQGASQIGSMMLSYVGQRVLQLEEMSLVDIARESVSELESSLQPSFSLEFIPPKHNLYCSIDPSQIKKVFQSILTNARESLGDESGIIEISFGLEHVAKESLPLFFQEEKHEDDCLYAFCQIKDSGHGISQENIQQIFEPFYSTRLVGRGLGLALSGGIIQTHGGAITIESTVGAGSTVRILLPSITLSPQKFTISSDSNSVAAVPLSGDVLLADDEPIILMTIQLMLEDIGFTVHTAVDGREAVGKFREEGRQFCAVILDILMPEMTGIEAMKEIKEIDPDIPVLLISGYSEDEAPFQEITPDAFMVKPVQQSDMKSKLEDLLS